MERITLGPLVRALLNSLPEKHFAILLDVKARLFGASAECPDDDLDLDEKACDSGRDEATVTADRLRRLSRILERMRETTETWGGEFHVIYLPGAEHFHFGPHPLREEVLSLADGLAISVIDMVPVFEAQKNPGKLFAFEFRGTTVRSATAWSQAPSPRRCQCEVGWQRVPCDEMRLPGG